MADLSRKPGPNDPGGAWLAMVDAWQMIADIRKGAAAVRKAGQKYLPKFEEEDQTDYERRVKSAPWRPEFNDALAALVAKPFTQDMTVDGLDAELKEFIEDVDTQGNSLTVFAREAFEDGIAAGMHGIFVEHTPSPGGNGTVAEEKAAGSRPYFIHIDALRLIAVYFDVVNGKMVVSQARIRECLVVVDGFVENKVEQVRVLRPGVWEVWRQNGKNEWMLYESGVTSLSYVPLVLYFTGEREDNHRVRPPLQDLADLQIELYRALSREDEILNFSGFPMLSGNGFAKPKEKVVVGPRRILFAPPGNGAPTSWGFVQPDAANLAHVAIKCQQIATDIARLGMQPIVHKTGNPTATAASIDAAKAHSVLQSWVVGLEDALEQAFVIVGDYKGRQGAPVEIKISKDFSAEPFAQAPLVALRAARDARDISQKTYWEGLRRFDVLPAGFDADAEEQLLAEESQELAPETQIDPITGKPVVPPNKPMMRKSAVA